MQLFSESKTMAATKQIQSKTIQSRKNHRLHQPSRSSHNKYNELTSKYNPKSTFRVVNKQQNSKQQRLEQKKNKIEISTKITNLKPVQGRVKVTPKHRTNEKQHTSKGSSKTQNYKSQRKKPYTIAIGHKITNSKLLLQRTVKVKRKHQTK